MSYYDWVQNVQLLKTSPMDDSIITHLQNQKLDNNKYVINKLTIHFIKALDARINNSLLNCLKEMSTTIDLNTTSMLLINIKNEKNYVSKIVNLPIFDITNKQILKDFIEKKFEYANNLIKQTIEIMDTDGEYISAFEKIMSNDMEERI